MNKKFYLLTILALIVALLLVACGGQVEEPAPAELEDTASTTTEEVAEEPVAEVQPATEDGEISGSLEFMTGTSIDSELFIAYEELTDAFTATNPGVNVELVPSSTDHEGEIKTRLASGNIPDIWMKHGWSVGRYGDFLLPLEDEAWAADLNPALEPVMVSDEGHLYAFPIDLDIAGILYNADVLAEAGVAPEDIKTWDDFMADADAVAANGQIPI